MEDRYILNYDLKSKIVTDIRFKQGNVDTSVLEITLFDNGVVTDITGEIIEFRFAKPDSTIVYQDAASGVSVLDVIHGRVQCILKSNTLASIGMVKCEIHRSKDGKELTTPTFNFEVEASIGQGGILSTNYISSIENELINIKTDETIRVSAEDNRVINENQRIIEFTNLKTDITNGVTLHTNMQGDITTSTALDITLKSDIVTGNTLDTNLKADISSGTALKTTLESDITKGTMLDTALSADIVTGNTLDVSLKSDINLGNTLKTALETDINSATTKKTDLQTVIATANTTTYATKSEINLVNSQLLNIENNGADGNSVNIKKLGAIGNGIMDDSIIIENANSLEIKSIFFPKGNYLISKSINIEDKILIFDFGASLNISSNIEVTLDNCFIDSPLQQIFKGSGKIRGVLSNDKIIHDWFEINYNILPLTARTKFVEVAEFYVDSLLGNDTNDGLTISTCLRTFQRAITKVTNLVSVNVNRATDIKVVFRTGRYEIDSTVTIGTSCSLNNSRVILKSMNGEKAEFTPTREYYFTSKQPSSWYNTHPVYSHSIGYPIYSLWESDTDEETIVANSIKNRTLNRNQNNNVIMETINGIKYAELLADVDVISKLIALNQNELNNTLVITWQCFTQTFAKLEMFNNNKIYYKNTANVTWATDTDYDYEDGYYRFDDSHRSAPYYLLNCKAYLDDATFYSSSTEIYLPSNYKHSYYTSKKIGFPIKLSTTGNITFNNIIFKNFVYSQSTIETIWTGVTYTMQYILQADGINNKNFIVDNCTFKDSEISALYFANSSNTKITNNNCLNMGSGGFILYDDTALVDNNIINNIGKLFVNGSGIIVTGKNFTISNNIVNRYGYNAIRSNQSSLSTGNCYIFRNVISNGGCDDDGRFDETRSLMDGGALYIFGKVNGNQVNLEIYENIIYNCYGHAQYRGIFCDACVSNNYIHDNLIYNVQYYTIDLKQVYNTNSQYGGTIDVPLTLNNTVSRNIVSTSMRLEGGRDITKPNYGEALGNVLTSDNIILCDKSHNTTNAFSGLANTTYIKDTPFFTDSKNISLDVLMLQKLNGYYIKPYLFKFINPYSISFVPSRKEIFEKVIINTTVTDGVGVSVAKWTKVMSVNLVGAWVNRHIRLFYYARYNQYNYGEVVMNFSTELISSTFIDVSLNVNPIGAKTNIIGQNDFIVIYNQIDVNTCTWVAELYIKINITSRNVNFYTDFTDGDYTLNPIVTFYNKQPFLEALPTGTQVLPFATTGITSRRPTGIEKGYSFYDTTLNKPIWWNGTVWKDATGTTV